MLDAVIIPAYQAGIIAECLEGCSSEAALEGASELRRLLGETGGPTTTKGDAEDTEGGR